MPNGRVTISEMLEVMGHFKKLSPAKRRIFLEHLERKDVSVEVLVADLKEAFARLDAEQRADKRH
jgi:hypothetical protein